MKKSGYQAPAFGDGKALASARIAIVATRWNVAIVDALVAGAKRALADARVKAVSEHRAPGAFELPLAAEMLARAGRHDGVIALGAVIRGDTPHFEYVAGACARGLQEVSLRHALPVGFGVLTVNTVKQAVERAGKGRDNKGYECAVAVLEMIALGRAVSG